MQNSVNHRDFERTWHFQVSLGSMFLRVEFPPHLGGAPPAGARPEAASGAHSVARHWLKLGSVGRALRAPARRFVRVGVPGYCLQMGPSGSHRRASGVSSRAPTVADVPLDIVPVWIHRECLFASACPPPSRAHRAAARVPYVCPASEPPPSNGARLPAELKHITKRRKRNQQGCP